MPRLEPRRSRFVFSKTAYEIEMAGSAFAKLGRKPLYSARTPPSATVRRRQSTTPSYAGIPGSPCAYSRVRTTCSGYATAWPIVDETAPHARNVSVDGSRPGWRSAYAFFSAL